MAILDAFLGNWKRYRAWRGGRWQLLCCPDGFWIKLPEKGSAIAMTYEDYKR